MYEQLGDRHGLAEALVGLGETAVVQGRYEEARALLEEAVGEARAAGDQRRRRHRPDRALRPGGRRPARGPLAGARGGLQLARELDFRWGELYGLDGAALLAAREGSWEVAATLLGATELPREASPTPQLGVREAGIAGVTAALDSHTLSALWDTARAMPLDRAIAYALQHL